MLRLTLKWRWLTVGLAAAALASAVWVFSDWARFCRAMEIVRLPSISLEQAVTMEARFIHGAIEVDPLAFDLQVSLIHAPRVADRPRVPAPALLKFRHVTLHPP